MKFGELTLRKIIKLFATRCLILGLKCTKNRFRLGLCPRPRCGSLQRSPDHLAQFGGPTSKGRGRERREGTKGRVGKGRAGEEREREGGRKGKGEDDCYSKLFLGPGQNSHNREEDEIRKRKNNIVTYRVPELVSDDVMERRWGDAAYVHQLCSDVYWR